MGIHRDTHTLTYRITHSAYTKTLGIDQRRQERRLKCPLRHIHETPRLVPPGSGQKMCLLALRSEQSCRKAGRRPNNIEM